MTTTAERPLTVGEVMEHPDGVTGQITITRADAGHIGFETADGAKRWPTPYAFWHPEAPPPEEVEPEAPVSFAAEELTTERLLSDVREFLTDYVVFTSPREADAIALWVLHTYVVNQFDSTPRLVVRAPTIGSGKTRVMECLAELCKSATHTLKLSAAAMFRTIEMKQPTLLVDETDTIFGQGVDPSNSDLLGAIDAGFRKGATYIRCHGAELEPREFHVYAPVALAGNGSPPASILDRAVIINLQRKGKNDKVKRFRMRDAADRAEPIRKRLAAWAASAEIPLAPVLDEVADRAGDVWESLLSIANYAGGDWKKRGRLACLEMCDAWAEESNTSEAVELLAHIREAFGDRDRIASADLIFYLVWQLPESPYERYGRTREPLQPPQLAGALKPFKIKPTALRVVPGQPTVRGYYRADFQDAWDSYLADR